MNSRPTDWDVVFRPRQTIVYTDYAEGVLGVWNGSLTINWYNVDDERQFWATDCTTMQGDDRGDATLEEAIQCAHEMVAYWRGGEDDED